MWKRASLNIQYVLSYFLRRPGLRYSSTICSLIEQSLIAPRVEFLDQIIFIPNHVQIIIMIILAAAASSLTPVNSILRIYDIPAFWLDCGEKKQKLKSHKGRKLFRFYRHQKSPWLGLTAIIIIMKNIGEEWVGCSSAAVETNWCKIGSPPIPPVFWNGG